MLDPAEFGDVDAAPTVIVMHHQAANLGLPCFDTMSGKFAVVVSLSARFTHSDAAEHLLARLGAISESETARYWSVTERHWRSLIERAYAVTNTSTRTQRPDFSAQEVLSGKPLIFVQDDTRSSGENLYQMRGKTLPNNAVLLESFNLDPIRLWIKTIFAPRELYAQYYFRELGDGQWGFYGVTAVRQVSAIISVKSLINRAAAFYYYLANVPHAQQTPLAR